jgi:hypothetical protein
LARDRNLAAADAAIPWAIRHAMFARMLRQTSVHKRREWGMEATWNTGRKPTSARQIIKARVQPDGSILFVDVSRGVDGVTAKPRVQVDSEAALKAVVMRAYDRRAYRSSKGRWMALLHPEKAA